MALGHQHASGGDENDDDVKMMMTIKRDVVTIQLLEYCKTSPSPSSSPPSQGDPHLSREQKELPEICLCLNDQIFGGF